MLKALPTLAVLLSCTLVLSVSLHAMEIEKFDKMAIPDKGDYVALLLEGAQSILRDAARHDDLAKVNRLFTEVREGDKMTIGMLQFEENLDRARLLDAERYAKEHSATRLEVEHAMIVTLKKNGIILPKSFMTVGKDFKPKHPPKDEKK